MRVAFVSAVLVLAVAPNSDPTNGNMNVDMTACASTDLLIQCVVMDWTQACERLRAQRNYSEVGKAVGLHPNGIRNYALGRTIPRHDNAQKIIEYLLTHDRRQGDRRQERTV